MSLSPSSFIPNASVKTTAWFPWKLAQLAVWLVGVFIFGSLIFYPALGLLLFWNILIPIAPALLVVSTGLWRNICPLATTVLLPRHLHFSKQQKMPVKLQAILGFAALLALFIIVPLRHAVFNTSGLATAWLLFICAAIGFGMGMKYDWKSGWCSSLCPIHPVEKLYGANTLFSFPNAHCTACVNCSVPCPDATPNMHPALTKKIPLSVWSSHLLIGGLPGFIWGWFHVSDYHNLSLLSGWLEVYQYPITGLLMSLTMYFFLFFFLPKQHDSIIRNIFAAAAVSCYYWYRIPALVGMGTLPNDGILIDLSSHLAPWLVRGVSILVSVFFVWWMVWRQPNKKSWLKRPAFKTSERIS